MKIVVLDAGIIEHADLLWKRLETKGEVNLYEKTKIEEIPERINDADIVIINGIHTLKEEMKAYKKLKFVNITSTGYNNIDVKLAKELGIVVSNSPNYSTPAVAQFTFALLLEACHHAGEHAIAVKEGEWERSFATFQYRYPQMELKDKTIGILGFGNIGQEVAKIANGFGMKVLAFSREPDYSKEHELLQFVSLDELYSKSDFITLHYPYLPHTKGMINKESLSKMKDGVILVNTARGGLIEEEDLREALISGKVAFAALDVVVDEPITRECPLFDAPNVIITPHMAWGTKESRERLVNLAITNVEAFLQGKPVNVVS